MILAHFNPSTLKVSYELAERKQLVANVICSHCPNPIHTPYEITVTLSDFTYCTTCNPHDVYSAKVFDHQNAANDYLLKWAGVVDEVCYWKGLFTGNYGEYEGYNGYLDCTPPANRWDITLDRLYLELRLYYDEDFEQLLRCLKGYFYRAATGTGCEVVLCYLESYTLSDNCMDGSKSVTISCPPHPLTLDVYASAFDFIVEEN